MPNLILTAKAGDKTLVYTGRAGDAWVSEDRSQAFRLGFLEASRKADLFNGRRILTGLIFVVSAA